jgi:hypothetical protein
MNLYFIKNTASMFWEQVGGPPPTSPRNLEEWFPFAYRLAVEYLPKLTIQAVNEWARKSGFSHRFPGDPKRQLCGCLLPGTTGIIFVDAEDSENEQRFTIAHELSHFICDYLLPRERAIRELGEGIVPVLNGERQPTPEERLDGALAGGPLRMPGHLMERPVRGLPSNTILDVEDRADRLALELLAPEDMLHKRMRQRDAPTKHHDRLAFLIHALYIEYGLPHVIDEFYAKLLLRQWGEPLFRSWLFDED